MRVVGQAEEIYQHTDIMQRSKKGKSNNLLGISRLSRFPGPVRSGSKYNLEKYRKFKRTESVLNTKRKRTQSLLRPRSPPSPTIPLRGLYDPLFDLAVRPPCPPFLPLPSRLGSTSTSFVFLIVRVINLGDSAFWAGAEPKPGAVYQKPPRTRSHLSPSIQVPQSSKKHPTWPFARLPSRDQLPRSHSPSHATQ